MTVREPGRTLPVVHEADIAVAGGSCTGVFAAVRAARLGMRVVIIEKNNCFGGVATAGMVNVWHSLHDTGGRRQVIGGLTREMIERLEKRAAVMHGQNPCSAFRLNTEELKIELDELVLEHRVKPFLHNMYVAPVVSSGRLRALVIENKSGRQAIRARYFIDATGDADLARHLDLPMQDPGNLQPPTTCARISGMHELADFDWTAAVRKYGSRYGLEPDWGWGGAIPGLPGLQLRADTHVFKTDVTDAGQLTRAEIEGRRRIRAIMDIIRRYGPQPCPVALAGLASAIGARETRRVRARYRLTGRDILYGRRFEDAIANGTYPVDIHHGSGPGITFRYLDGTERIIPERGMPARVKRWREPLPENPTFYQVPFRCLVQDRVPNLVFSGRMIDLDETAFGAVRVMVNTNQTGEAAGVACALAAREDGAVADIDPAHLRRALAEGGSIIL